MSCLKLAVRSRRVLCEHRFFATELASVLTEHPTND